MTSAFTAYQRGASALATVVMLAACSSGASQLLASTPIQQNAVSPGMNRGIAKAADPDRGRSWMKPGVKGENLLYVTNAGTDDLDVYSYPQGQLLGTLTGFLDPVGECVDKTGDVFVTDYRAQNIVEYAHGGTSPIATLSDSGYHPGECSVDPTTGNLAVANSGGVSIYADAQGTPTQYADTNLGGVFFCGYDNNGNLFVDGVNNSQAVEVDQLRSGSSSFAQIFLNQSLGGPGGVQWDGHFLAVADSFSDTIYEFAIDPSQNTGVLIGSTTLNGSPSLGNQFWIQGRRIVALNFDGFPLLYHYPAGGRPMKDFIDASTPVGAVVSKGS
jgi:hypothetical protein